MSSPVVERGAAGPPRPRWRTWSRRGALRTIKWALGLVVVLAVARHAWRTWGDLRERRESVRVAAVPFVGAVALYVAGLVPFGFFYRRVLDASPTPIGRYPAVRAYVISHLGKYVPGKATVVLVRVGLSTAAGARAATSAFASLYETLVMMAAGGLIAAAGLGRGSAVDLPVPFTGGRSISLPLRLLGLGPGLALLVAATPAAFRRLAGLARMPFPGVGPDALPSLSIGLLGEGLAWASVGWVLLGLSQVAAIAAIEPAGLPASAWPVAIASVALATVAGFLVPIAPGGLGVREWVLWTALAATIDRDRAVVAALLLRLAWVVGEVAAAVTLGAIRPATRRLEATGP